MFMSGFSTSGADEPSAPLARIGIPLVRQFQPARCVLNIDNAARYKQLLTK
jgi:hypothetical protein